MTRNRWIFSVCLIWLAALIVSAFLVDFLPVQSALQIDLTARFHAPGIHHWAGTDELGRDVFSRLLHAARSTMTITIGATMLDIAIAVIASLVAAYKGGWVDKSLSIVVDFFWSVPLVVLVVLITSIVGVQVWTLIGTIAGINWVSATRILRAESYRLRNAPFVRAARAHGLGDFSIMANVILPNLRPLVVAVSAYTAIEVITLESGLAFLGLSLPAPAPSWGGILADGATYFGSAWWLASATSATIVATLGSLLVVGRYYEREVAAR